MNVETIYADDYRNDMRTILQQVKSKLNITFNLKNIKSDLKILNLKNI